MLDSAKSGVSNPIPYTVSPSFGARASSSDFFFNFLSSARLVGLFFGVGYAAR